MLARLSWVFLFGLHAVGAGYPCSWSFWGLVLKVLGFLSGCVFLGLVWTSWIGAGLVYYFQLELNLNHYSVQICWLICLDRCLAMSESLQGRTSGEQGWKCGFMKDEGRRAARRAVGET